MIKSFAAALAFYTVLPIPSKWDLDFQYVARLAPWVGLLLGGLLVVEDWLLSSLTMPLLTRSAIIVASGVALTGGLHMDGAMDTADGLAVMDKERRLEVMADSNTGAFGAMVAVVLLGLKVAALADLSGVVPLGVAGPDSLGTGLFETEFFRTGGFDRRWLMLLIIPMWGRWAQQVAIATYPYLKPTGKGAFHKAALASTTVIGISGLICSLITITCWTLIDGPPWTWNGMTWTMMGIRLGIVLGVAIATGAWFNSKLGGHTGDTYGAVVEWTEAITLALFTLL